MKCLHSVTSLVTKMQFHNSSFLLGAAVPVYAAGLKHYDTIYNPLPLYHSSAGMLCCGPSFFIGCTIALRKKFSAKAYWKDCVKYNATVSTHYIRNMYVFCRGRGSFLSYRQYTLVQILSSPELGNECQL